MVTYGKLTCIEAAWPSYYAMNLVAFFEEKLCQIGAVLARYPGNQRHFVESLDAPETHDQQTW